MSIWSPGYRNSHRSVAAKLLTEEHDQFAEIAKAKGIAPATLCRQLIQAEIARHADMAPAIVPEPHADAEERRVYA